MDKETLLARNVINGLETAIEISSRTVRLSKKHAIAVFELLKKQISVKPYQDYNGHDVWRCGKCGATISNIYHTEADEDSKNYAKFCIHCGSAIEWEST